MADRSNQIYAVAGVVLLIGLIGVFMGPLPAEGQGFGSYFTAAKSSVVKTVSANRPIIEQKQAYLLDECPACPECNCPATADSEAECEENNPFKRCRAIEVWVPLTPELQDSCPEGSYPSQEECERETGFECDWVIGGAGEWEWFPDSDGDGLVHCEDSDCQHRWHAWSCPLREETKISCTSVAATEQECVDSQRGIACAQDSQGVWVWDYDRDGLAGDRDPDCRDV